MPKKVKFESFVYRFLIAAQEVRPTEPAQGLPSWNTFLSELLFSYDDGKVHISWKHGRPNSIEFRLDEARLYLRGDNPQYSERQRTAGLIDAEDQVKLANDAYFRSKVVEIALLVGYPIDQGSQQMSGERLDKERAFHDAWAASEDVERIDVRAANEVCTAPEMRYIRERLGDIRGKRLLDIGCGLGEASVYFALLGADVTASDLSSGMLEATGRLAAANGVRVTPRLAAAEDMGLAPNEKFDIIYAGNLLHHVDIDRTLASIKPHLAPDGRLVTWDPLAYNPVINVYRSIATAVRTPDEHPLTVNDLRVFRRHFAHIETRYFWLTTLLIFVLMALVQRRNPNQHRYWKTVVEEGNKWRWLYVPLEKLDRLLLKLIPPLRLLCWNVVVLARAA